jgi:predicted porin
VTLTYENGDVNVLNFGKTENVYLTGQYSFGNNIIRGSYGFTSPDDGQFILANGNLLQQSEVNNWTLGYQYNFSKRTRLWVEYLGQDVDSDLVGDRQTVSIGTRHDF